MKSNMRTGFIVILAMVLTGNEPIGNAAGEDSVAALPSGTKSFADAVSWLEQEAHRVIRESRRTMDDGTAAFPPQAGAGYEAFWNRDFEYALEGAVDIFSDQELKAACRVFVRALRADGAGVDCVKFDGTPIYMPGYTLDLADPALADQTVIDMVADFQKNGACEWIFGEHHRLPNYLASAALPLAGIHAMLERRNGIQQGP